MPRSELHYSCLKARFSQGCVTNTAVGEHVIWRPSCWSHTSNPSACTAGFGVDSRGRPPLSPISPEEIISLNLLRDEGLGSCWGVAFVGSCAVRRAPSHPGPRRRRTQERPQRQIVTMPEYGADGPAQFAGTDTSLACHACSSAPTAQPTASCNWGKMWVSPSSTQVYSAERLRLNHKPNWQYKVEPKHYNAKTNNKHAYNKVAK